MEKRLIRVQSLITWNRTIAVTEGKKAIIVEVTDSREEGDITKTRGVTNML